MKFKNYFIFSALLLFFSAPNLRPCSTPVFRYALEYWAPDPYQLIINGSDSLRFADDSRINTLRQFSFAGDSTLNVVIEHRVSPAGKAGKMWCELYYPAATRINSPVWQGEITTENGELLAKSPLRTELYHRLVAGQAAVWFFIPGPVAAENARAENVLRTTIQRLSDSLAVPVTGYDADGVPLARTDTTAYDVTFSFLKIDAADSTEDLLRQMLLGIEPDLVEYAAPIAIPVFGRGRALYGLVGRGINPVNITETCQSLLNWCSCQVKEENPGVDLLMQADWSEIQALVIHENELPELIGFERFLPDTLSKIDTTVSIPPIVSNTVLPDCIVERTVSAPLKSDSTAEISVLAVEAAPSDEKFGLLFRNLFLVFFLLIIVVAAGTLLLKRRR